MDFSFANFKNKGKGLLADPTQLMSNPLFSAGMGILSENSKPFGGDPFGSAMGGILSAKQQAQADEDRKRQEELREQLKKWMAAQAGQGAPGGGMVPNPYGGGMVPAAGSVAGLPQQQQGPIQPQDFMQMLQQGQLPGMNTLRYLYGNR